MKSAQSTLTTPRARAVLALLLFAYILNFLDRQILGILGPAIKADLHLTDTQFGAIGGLAFALLYSLLGVPLAFLADRTSRSAVIAGSLAVWSGFTALCGIAGGYWPVLFRLGVGLAKPGRGPVLRAHRRFFPPQRRAARPAIFSLGVPIGLGGGSFIGAYLASGSAGARPSDHGRAGILLAPIVKYFVRDLPRRRARPRR
jgi:MFS family permease